MKSELAWTLSDYEATGSEVPARIRDNPELTEGEMMDADEVAEFIKDSIATLRILADKRSPRFEQVVANFRADAMYLSEVGQIDEDDYNALISDHNLTF